MGAFKTNGVGTGQLAGYRLLFKCLKNERWMVTNVIADLERGNIEHIVRILPFERGFQVWRTEVGWLNALQREADAREARELRGLPLTHLEIQRERRRGA